MRSVQRLRHCGTPCAQWNALRCPLTMWQASLTRLSQPSRRKLARATDRAHHSSNVRRCHLGGETPAWLGFCFTLPLSTWTYAQSCLRLG